ncbi:MAG: hypothetical protein WC003_03490 [Terrimicrobiaceae bacterium]
MLKISLFLVTFCLLLNGNSSARAADAAAALPERNDRMGVATHFGYTDHYNTAKHVALAANLGVGWIRDGVNWRDVELSKGQYAVPKQTREWIDAAHSAGLKIVLIVGSYGEDKMYDNPYDPEAYAHMAAFLARELKGKVQALEILNEPHNFGFRQYYKGNWNGLEPDGSTSGWVGKYVELLNRAAKAIKASNPEMKVIGLGSVPPVNFRQLAMKVAPEVDGLVDHPYSCRTVPEIVPFAASSGILKRDGIATADERGTFASQMRMYRQTSAKNNGPKEIWLTEWGFPSYQEVKPGMFAGYTREAQGKYILRRFMESLGLNIETSVVYDLKDDGTSIHDPEHGFGLLTWNDEPKPSYVAVQRLARYMIPYRALATPPEINVFTNNSRPDEWPITWDGSKLAAPGSVATYAFETAEHQPMLAVWSSERAGSDLQPRTADIEILGDWPSASVRAHDLWTGETADVACKRSPGKLLLSSVTIPDHPVAIEFR